MDQQGNPLPIRVSVIEDHDPTREEFTRLLRNTPGFEFVSAHPSAEDALAHWPLGQTQVVLVDLGLPGMCGVECIRHLCARDPELLVLVNTVLDDGAKLFESLRAGACGYILKSASPTELLQAVRDAMAGGAPMSPSIARQVIRSFQPKTPSRRSPPTEDDPLTPREVEILEKLAGGYTYKEIGDLLSIGTETVRTHLKRIYRKLQVTSALGALDRWRRQGSSGE